MQNAGPKRASLHTLGCRLNQSETALIEERLRAEGYDIVPFGTPADLGIVNTCTVTREADAKSRQLVRSFIRKNPDAFVAVIGCYSQMGADALSDIDGVDLIVGNQEKLNVADYVRPEKHRNAVRHPRPNRTRRFRDRF
jgi:threonylcarbamoyladenosine tRNA methylthiotransferase MtaB